MFEVQRNEVTRAYRLTIAGLLALSVAALLVTIWVMFDFLREQEIVRKLIRQLPADAAESAEDLAGELRWQFRLTTLVVLNLIASGIALVLLARAYRASQQSLHNVKVLAADILNSMDQAVITTDRGGVVTSINRRGLELLGVDSGVIGRHLREACRVFDLESFRCEALQPTAARMVRDYVIPYAVGHRTFAAACQPLRDHQGSETGAVLQLRDITEQTLVEQQVQRMERFSGLGSLAAGLHHEIKNPLSALSLHVQLFEEQFEQTPFSSDTQDTLDVLKTEVARITAVLESFRNYASTDRLDRTLTNINLLVGQQLKFIAPQAAAAGVEVATDLKPGLPPVRIDKNKIEQVVLNLIINALEAMPHGGRMDVVTSARDRHIVVRISDDGCGVPESLRRRIFDPYFTTKCQGTGMGLALCEKIIRQHGGDLELCPTDRGAAFEIAIPIEPT